MPRYAGGIDDSVRWHALREQRGQIGLTSRSHAEYVEGATLLEMVKEDLIAERIAIDSYRDFIQYLDDKDPTTRRLLESILAMEEQHADELADLLQEVPPGLKAKPQAAVR